MSQFDELPEGWVETTLGDITLPFETCQPQKEPDRKFTYIDIGSIDNSIQNIVEPKKFLGKDAPSRARRIVKSGDVIFSTVRTYLKNIARVPDNFDGVLTSTGIAILRAAQGVDKDYIFHIVTSENFIREISRTMDGTLYPAVTDRDVNSAIIPLPPLNEQRRIVAKIEVLTARSGKARAALDEIPALLDQFRQSVLAAAFRGDLTADWRTQNPDVEPAEALLERIRVERRKHWEESELKKMRIKGKEPTNDKWKEKYKEAEKTSIERPSYLPEEWLWLSLAEIVEPDRPISYGILKPGDFIPDGIPMLRIVDIRNDEFNLESIHRVSSSLSQEYSRTLLGGGEVVISLVGTIGLVAKVPDFLSGTNIHRNLGFISPIRHVLSTFLLYWLKSPFARHQIELVTTGANQPLLNLNDVRNMAIPVPPIQEQREIIDKVNAEVGTITQVEDLVETSFQEISQLDRAILAKAFRGELVPQDPTDEPAAVLLDRIRAERERLGSGKKRGRAKG